jgi:(p)ppGpp synthase/HD superfamily hydrolase
MPGVRVILGPKFLEAVGEARRLHGTSRKGSDVPYMAHLLAVCALVLEDGGGEDEAIAALLHDAVEDAGGRQRLELIRFHFGQRVADIVDACSDSYGDEPKPPWRARKEAYLEHLSLETREEVLRVALADKLHNARCVLMDYRSIGERVWERFTARTAQEQLWYYRRLADMFSQSRPGPMAEELDRVVTELESLAAPRR